MELSRLTELLTGEMYEKLHEEVVASRDRLDYDILKKQIDPAQHAITDKVKRPDKTIYVPDPMDPDNADKLQPKKICPARLSLAMQKLIVSRAASFLCGNPIQLISDAAEGLTQDLVDVMQKTWDDNKLDYESKALAKLMMGETEVAEVWYTEDVDETYWEGTPNAGTRLRLRMKILANKFGDSLYPVFSASGDMIAFGRGYLVILDDKTKEEHFDLYTDDNIYEGTRKQGAQSWNVVPVENTIGKIPVVYYSQEHPEWYDVQSLIERLEELISNHSDTNDYTGSPTTIVKGTIKGFATKGEAGKILEVDPGGDVSLLESKGAPDSIKMEYANLRSLILDMTDTPDMSFEQMKNLGGNLTNFGVKMMFLAPHMKAADKEEIFGKGVQRRINYLKAAHAVINPKFRKALTLNIRPKFEYYLPENDVEKINMLSTARMGNLISQATQVQHNPLIEDKEQELKDLKAEADSLAAVSEQFNDE